MKIVDPIIAPFEIEIDDKQYTVITKRVSKKESNEDGKTPFQYEKTLGHFTNFEWALRAIAKKLVHMRNADNELTIKAYIDEYNSIVQQLVDKIKI